MKKILTLLAVVFSTVSFSQNLQLHYDFRNSIGGSTVSPNNYVTATFEMLKHDKYGNTFLFVDVDLNLRKGNVGLMYTEISRNFKLGKLPVLLHVEYNGGLGLFEVDKSVAGGFNIPNAYLGGVNYPFQIKGAFFSLNTLYRYNNFEKVSNDIQFTFVWAANFFNNKLTLTGFTDVWTENKSRTLETTGKKVVFLTEPQVWFNINKVISIGGEIEISSNFVSHKTHILPTAAIKINL